MLDSAGIQQLVKYINHQMTHELSSINAEEAIKTLVHCLIILILRYEMYLGIIRFLLF